MVTGDVFPIGVGFGDHKEVSDLLVWCLADSSDLGVFGQAQIKLAELCN
jgi:hypothetical protein